jgi:phosphonate transport system permease protein
MSSSADAAVIIDGPDTIFANLRARTLRSGIVLLAVLAYLSYTWVAFDMNGLIETAKPERAVLLANDAVAHKVHVTKSMRTGETKVAIEGERTATYETPPSWVQTGDISTRVNLGDGYEVVIFDNAIEMYVPDYGTITASIIDNEIETILPEGKAPPDWLRAVPSKFDARPDLRKRVQMSRAKIEVHRYFTGWENFFFPFNSPLSTYSFSQIVSLIFSDQRLDPEMANWRLVFDTFWENPDWQHGNVFVALLETLLMAVLGTVTAAFVALPLAFFAAQNFSPSTIVRFFVRRLFDLLRGIDMLVWSLIFIRAFGLGPLTGTLAIAFTDTGELGKLFSEALENTDEKQVDGVQSTGASKVQVYRFGVIPQILPIFISQTLYYLESNIRSATVIGALGAGGIGLMLVETIRTSRDWENTLYLILLTLFLVIAMDKISGSLRKRLIQGRDAQG